MRVASIEIAAKAVLFDMDGVVVDSRSVIEMAWREVVRKFDGRELTELEIRTVAHGRTPEQTIETLFPEYGDEQLQEIWSEAARIEMSAPYEAIPGVEDFIERLISSGIAIGLVTSSWPEKIEYVLGLLNLREVFSTVVNRDDVTRGKPFPDPYLLGCERLGTAPAETVVFVDSLTGVQSAVAANTVCVGLGGTELIEACAIDTIADFSDLELTSTESGGLLALGIRPQISWEALQLKSLR